MVHYNFDLDLPEGHFGEESLAKILAGKIEVKTDYMAHFTGNIAVEYESRGKRSGIATTEADWWAFNIVKNKMVDRIIFIRTNKLKIIAREHLDQAIIGGDDNTSKMVLIPINKLFNRS